MHIIDTPTFIVDLNDLQLEPMGSWELNVFYDNPDIGPMVGKAIFTMMGFQESISASLDLTWTQETLSSSALPADLDGQLTNNSVQFQLHIDDVEWQLAPFVCHGRSVTNNSSRYEGKWQVACISPETCGGDCTGTEGEFSLTKISN
ncbi:MAG: hypothetical protein HKP09_03775 [Enterobacterales bacterium]|nr:hypothetical protein [Enterobacterales bacterium]